MIAIGNGEKCPWCELFMENYQIDGKDSSGHFLEKHKDEFMKSLFGKDKHIGL